MHGLAITARCDFAQRKFPVLNYVPVVELHDWVRRDGLDILVDQELNDQRGQLVRMLKQAQVSEALLQAVPHRQIAETHFPKDEGSKAKKAAAQKFHDLVDEMVEFSLLVAADGGGDIFEWFNRLLKRPAQDVTLAYCWAHARRKLHDVTRSSTAPVAQEGLTHIQALYRIEKDLRGLIADQRHAARQECSKPIIDTLELWLAQSRARVSAKSPTGEALKYIAKYWDGLCLESVRSSVYE